MAVKAVIFDTAIWPLPRPGRVAGAIWDRRSRRWPGRHRGAAGAGRVRLGGDRAAAAAHAAAEQRPDRLRGTVFVTRRAIRRGPPEADFEAERIEWIPLTDAPALISGGQVKDASTAAALLWLHASMPRIEPW